MTLYIYVQSKSKDKRDEVIVCFVNRQVKTLILKYKCICLQLILQISDDQLKHILITQISVNNVTGS